MDYPWTPAEEVDPDLIRRLYETNVVGLVRTMRVLALAHRIRQPSRGECRQQPRITRARDH